VPERRAPYGRVIQNSRSFVPAQNLAIECKKIKGFATTAARFIAAAGGDIVLPGSTTASVAQPK
jgi:hypothetical protein